MCDSLSQFVQLSHSVNAV